MDRARLETLQHKMLECQRIGMPVAGVEDIFELIDAILTIEPAQPAAPAIPAHSHGGRAMCASCDNFYSEEPGVGCARPQRHATPAPEPAAAPAVGEGATEEAAAADSAFIEADRKHRQAEGGMHTELRDRWFRRGWAAARSYFAPAPAAGLVTAEMVEALRYFANMAAEYDDQLGDPHPEHHRVTVALGACRKARAALSARQEGGA